MSNNMFQDVLTDAKGVANTYIGPDYPYYKYIKTPSEIGMSSKGDLKTLGKDVDGLVKYVELLVSGGGKASATGKPLGNKFFLKTGGTCTDKKTNKAVDRYIYINNVPTGNIPLISSGMGVNFSEFKGLIPGTISNLNAFNPMDMFNYIATMDIENMDPCIFPNKKNPLNGDKCKESFSNLTEPCYTCYKIPNEPISNVFFGSLGILGIYILYRIMDKNGMIPKS